MLGMYLYTLIIGHKSCNKYTKKINIAKEFTKFCEKQYVVFGQKVKHKQIIKKNKKKTNKQPLPEPSIKPRTSCTQSGCITTATPSLLRVSFVVKLFNWLYAMGRNVNKQSRICDQHTFNKFIFP